MAESPGKNVVEFWNNLTWNLQLLNAESREEKLHLEICVQTFERWL